MYRNILFSRIQPLAVGATGNSCVWRAESYLGGETRACPLFLKEGWGDLPSGVCLLDLPLTRGIEGVAFFLSS